MRILAITADASIEVALATIDPSFEIAAVKDPDGAIAQAAHANVALVALGTTARGVEAVEALHRLGVGVPCLIIGDAAAPDGFEASVLVRPFSMQDLIGALRSTAASPRRAPAPISAPPEPVHQPPPEDAHEPPPEDVYEPPAELEPPPAPTPEPLPENAPAYALPPDLEPELPPEPEPEPEPEPAYAPAPEPIVAAAPPAPEPEPTSPQPAPPERTREWALALLNEIGQSHEGLASEQAIVVRHAAAVPPPSPLIRPERSGMHRLRKRRRSVAPSPVSSSRASTLRRVRAALEGARDLEALLADMPVLADPDATASALIREVVDLLGPETAALYSRSTSGSWNIAASHGLSHAERALVIGPDQPLFLDVSSRLEAVLVAPVDLVRGLVGGIGGTGVETLMLAPLEVDGTCHGILLTGRSAFADEDLERLWLLAEEAAPGFAASRLLHRLRAIDAPVMLPMSS